MDDISESVFPEVPRILRQLWCTWDQIHIDLVVRAEETVWVKKSTRGHMIRTGLNDGGRDVIGHVRHFPLLIVLIGVCILESVGSFGRLCHLFDGIEVILISHTLVVSVFGIDMAGIGLDLCLPFLADSHTISHFPS